MMRRHYEIYFFQPLNAEHLGQWLDEKLTESGLKLVCSLPNSGFVFEFTETSFAQDAMESYGEFFDKMVIALGYSSATLPCEEADNMMIKKVSDLLWLSRNLADALKVMYEKLPPHWRDLPFSYSNLMQKVKEILR